MIKNFKSFNEGKKEKFDELMKNENKILQILEEGGKKANSVAEEKMKEVRREIGLTN